MGIEHLRVTLLGTMAQQAEAWSCGFGAIADPGITADELQTMADTASFLGDTELWTGIKDKYPPGVKFVGARVQHVSDGGVVLGSAESILTTPDAGTGGTAALPSEVAVVISLRTATAGARGRGRMYMPGFAADVVTAAGAILPAATEQLADASQEFFNAWNADPTTTTAVVVSMVGSSTDAINSIRVGSIYDSQRRRRDALVESYQSRAITV